MSINKANVYIDGANLHRASLELGHTLSYKKFNRWLNQKYSAHKIYLFIGLVPHYTKLYEKLQEDGYILVFKETVTKPNGEVKGNCDAELVLKAMEDYYEQACGSFVLISGDGDFRCLVDFLIDKKQEVRVLAPNRKKVSILLKRTNSKITNLDEHYHKFLKT